MIWFLAFLWLLATIAWGPAGFWAGVIVIVTICALCFVAVLIGMACIAIADAWREFRAWIGRGFRAEPPPAPRLPHRDTWYDERTDTVHYLYDTSDDWD